MGSTIYSQTLKHPVFISYECEHCSQMNSFSQEIKGSGSAEVSNLSSNRNRQSKYNSVGPKAEQNLIRQIQKAKLALGQGDYSWIKFHPCSKCGYTQSWQTSRLFKRSIKFFVLDILIVFVLISWLTSNSSEAISRGLWGFFAFLGLVVLIPILVLALALRKRDKARTNKPDVSL